MDSYILQGLGVEISEDKENKDFLQGKFCICDFDRNKNNVRLNRETIDSWVSTLVGTPLVGKIAKNIKNKNDFTSHNMKIVSFKDENGKTQKKAVFDTQAFGVCQNVSIEKAKDGNDYIYATYRIWKRFENACKIIQERANNLHTSWEIAVENYSTGIENGEVVKTINLGRFIGLALLSENTPPAYDSSGLLEVASEQENELNTALIEDLVSLNISSDIKQIDDKEVKINMNNDTIIETNISESTEAGDTQIAENIVSENQVSGNSKEGNENIDVSALTDRDIRRKLEKEYFNKYHKYCDIWLMFPNESVSWIKEYSSENIETECVEVKYKVENDEISILEANKVVLTVSPREINQVIAQKDNAIVEMSAQIQSLNTKIEKLQPYKDKVEQIEKAEKEAKMAKDRQDLLDYAISSGYITKEEIDTSEEISNFIQNLDKHAVQSLIADRVVESLSKDKNINEVNISQESKKDVETPNVQINLSAEKGENKNNQNDALWIVKEYISK